MTEELAYDFSKWEEWTQEQEASFFLEMFGFEFDPEGFKKLDGLGENIQCDRTGCFFPITDGYYFIEGCSRGLVQGYFLGATLLLCGYKGKDVRQWMNTRTPKEKRLKNLMFELTQVFLPVSSIVDVYEQKIREEFDIITDDVYRANLPLMINFLTAKRVQYILKNIQEIAKEEGFDLSSIEVEDDAIYLEENRIITA